MAKTLVVHLSEDAWNGDAQFTLDVDGIQIAGPTSVTTAHGSGFQDFTYNGDYGDSPHTVTVHFLNDAWGGSASTDRNLYVGGIDFDGVHYTGETAQNTAMSGQPNADPNAAEMYVNGTVTFAGVTPPGPPDTLVVYLSSSEPYLGFAQYTVDVDGIQVGAPTDVRAVHNSGVQALTYTGTFGAGPHTVAVHFINDAWDGSSASDRNLYVVGIDYNGQHHAGQSALNDAQNGQPDADPNAAEIYVNGTVTFQNVSEGSPTGSVFLISGSGNDILGGASGTDTIHGGSGNDIVNGGVGDDFLSGDNGDDVVLGGPGNDLMAGGQSSHQVWGFGYATLNDGRDVLDGGPGNDTMIGGPETTFLIHAGNGNDTIVNYFRSSSPYAAVVLDGYRLGSMDDVRAQTTHSGSSTFVNLGNGEILTFAAFNAAPQQPPLSVDDVHFVFTNVTSGIGPSSEIVLHLSEDAWNGDAQFVVAVDGVQIGDSRTAIASHGSAVQDITITGDFGTQGPGTIDIQFINDAWGGSASADRNLYVQSIDVNGVHFQGNAASNTAANGAEAMDTTAAVMAINGVAEFHIDQSTPPQIVG